MARRRRRRRSAATPLILVSLLLAAIVVWSISPRGHARKPSPPPLVQTSPASSPSPVPAASPLTATASPAATPATPAAPPSFAPNAPKLAIIIDDCGQWFDIERGFIALPIPLTLSVMPGVRYTARIADLAEQGGKGVMLHLPMEPISHAVSGPGQIDVGMTDDAIAAQTESDVDQVPLAAGVNNHEGSAATADLRVMTDVMEIVKRHGLFFVDSRTTAKTVAARTAQADGVPNASRNVFLDNVATVAYTESMLQQAAALAKEKGFAIAIGHPKTTTLQALRHLYPRIEAQGVRFVRVSELVR